MKHVIRIYKTKNFCKWAKKEKIADKLLINATNEISNGKIDADLGAGLIKQRIAKPCFGKRGSYRTLIAFKRDDKAFFVFGFSKGDKDNIDHEEKKIYKELAKSVLMLSDTEIESLIKEKELFEVKNEPN